MVLHGFKTLDVRPTSQLAGCEGKLLGVRLSANSWGGAELSAEVQAEIAARRGAGTLVDASFLGRIAGTVRVGRTMPALEAAREAGGWEQLCASVGFAHGGRGGIRTRDFVTELFEPSWLLQPIKAAGADFRCVTDVSVPRGALGKRRALGRGRESDGPGAGCAGGGGAGGGGDGGSVPAVAEEQQWRLQRFATCQCASSPRARGWRGACATRHKQG